MKNLAYTIAGLALLASGGAFAQITTETDTIAVSAEVTGGCADVTATDVDFGAQPQTDTDSTDTSTITVSCTAGTPYTVEINYGLTPQGTIRTVTGSGAGAAIDYYVYQDAARTIPWGTAAQSEELDGTGTGSPEALTAYFLLDRNIGDTPDIYTDLLTVTLTF